MASLPATHPVIGDNTNNLLIGTRLSDVMSGRFGDDDLRGAGGNDEVWGGTGDDILHGQNGNDILYGSGGPSLLNFSAVEITDDYPVSVIFEGETAGYRNTFGYYKVDENGFIQDTKFVWPNASLAGSGGSLIQGVSQEFLDVSAGDKIGFFIVSNGFGLNGGYSGIDLDSGALKFLEANGSPASLTSTGPKLYHVADDGTQTEIRTHSYHTAAHGENVGLNPDGLLHTTGVLKTDKGTVTLGFEDLYNGGDRDFDDSVFTVDIGLANALVLNAHYNAGSGGTDPEAGGDLPEIVRSDNDTLLGGAGADELHGRSGDDLLYGNTGADELHGGSGNDFLDGSSGNDQLFGNSGNDELQGGSGDDVLNGNNGDDVLSGGTGEDALNGGTGNDSLDGGNHDDSLIGGSGDDVLAGGYGNDVLKGGAGSDHLFGGHNDDQLFGGHGDDFFFGDAGDDLMHGGRGIDTVDYSAFDVDLSVMLHNKRAHGQEIGTDTLKYIDNVISGGGDDFLKGSRGENVIEGGAGNDEIRGMGSADLLTGGAGADTFVWRSHDLDASDTITDFDLEADFLDFSSLLGNVSFDESSSRSEQFEDLLQTDFNADTGLNIALDMSGDGSFTDVATLANVGNLTSDQLMDYDCFII